MFACLLWNLLILPACLAAVDADLRSVFEKYGALKKVEIVRDVVTGESRGYAFVEFEKRSSMKTAFKASESLVVHDKPLLVDYARTGVVEGWIPRRFGGGLGGRKESGSSFWSSYTLASTITFQTSAFGCLLDEGSPWPIEGVLPVDA
eukprot:gene4411-5419_t